MEIADCDGQIRSLNAALRQKIKFGKRNMIRKTAQLYRLDTPGTTLLIDPLSAEYLYYGQRLVSGGTYESLRGGSRRLFSQFGIYEYTEQSVLFYNADGGFTTDFRLKKSRVLRKKPEIAGLPSSYGAKQTLELEYCDAPAGVRLILRYSVFADCDVIAVSAELVNGSRRDIRVRRLCSLQLDLIGSSCEITTFEGEWGRERARVRRTLNGGVFCNDSKRGESSHVRNPFMEVCGEDGSLYAFNLVYSGNHKEFVECDEFGRTRVLVGMNDFMFDWRLAPGEKFCTPEAIMCFCQNEDSMSCEMHRFVNNHIVRGNWQNRPRPIVVNNWEGTYLDFTEEKLLDIARVAKEAGVEIFVVDDGWFGKRDTDTCSLGDWVPNLRKLPGGMRGLADKIRAMGLGFGFWIEPEMINEDSDLFRAHPEYAMRIPGREPLRSRHQLALDLTRRDVQDEAIRAVCNAIEDCGAVYVKWDYNRFLTDCYGEGIAQGEYFHRYMLGFYRIAREVTARFSEVLFEGCASGGGRFDLGALCYFPQIWTSDNTDARDRIAIQDGTSYGYPQSAIIAHIAASPNHQTGNRNALETRFNVASGGIFGFQLDMMQFDESERETAAREIGFYKQYREHLQFCTYYRLGDVFSSDIGGYITVSPDRAFAIAAVHVLKYRVRSAIPVIRLKGLAPEKRYRVQSREQANYMRTIVLEAGGDLLMRAGFRLNDIFEDTQRGSNSGGVYSRMLILEELV